MKINYLEDFFHPSPENQSDIEAEEIETDQYYSIIKKPK